MKSESEHTKRLRKAIRGVAGRREILDAIGIDSGELLAVLKASLIQAKQTDAAEAYTLNATPREDDDEDAAALKLYLMDITYEMDRLATEYIEILDALNEEDDNYDDQRP